MTIIAPGGVEAEALLDLLRALPASGVGSFENLVRDLLSRTTGRRFTVAKSGPQGGIDSRTGDDRHATVIGVETKRYGLETKLPLDEIKSKLRDAATSHEDLDLWVLIASREIKEPDRGAMAAVGHQLGVEVLIWDWPESPELLPGLLLLCARHPDILDHYRLSVPEVARALDAVRAHPGFATQLADQATKLREPELGYANVRRDMAERIRENMASMTTAMVRIGRYANLTDPDIVRIDRPGVREAIAGWWEQRSGQSALALLGTEGMGKTWAALSWWLDREIAGNALPLTLIVPAKFIAEARPDAVIGKALFDMFGTRDAGWWAKRARRWCAGATETRLVLILDGLNERFEAQDWPGLLAELTAAPWHGAVATVLTDRADHWRLIAPAIANGTGLTVTEQPIAQFSDPELDEILGRGGLKRGKLDEKLIRLLKVPRLCTLALRHWEKLGRSGDITPERLIYEDFRDRVFPELLDDDMRNLIAAIGDQIRGSATPDITVLRRDIRAALALESGAESSTAAISEIASGIWFAATPGEPNKLKINPDLAPVAIGLALARAVQFSASAAEVSARIEAFLDDLRGLELGVTIVGIAASFATIWPASTSVSRDCLLDTWLASANFSDRELKRYARVIQEAPELFLDRTERLWRDRQRLGDDRNVHLAGLVNAAEAYPNVLDAFVGRAAAWLGETFAWRDAMNGGEPIMAVTSAAVAAEVEAWNAARGPAPELTFIAFDGDNDWLSVAGTVLSAISYLPRAPFAAALGAYAVAMTVTLRLHYHQESFEWLLRANTVDAAEAEAGLRLQASAIAAVTHDDARKAADLLLEALGSLDPATQPVAPDRDEGDPGDDRPVDEHGVAPWTAGVRRGDKNWGERVLRNADTLAPAALDPTAELAAEDIALLRDAFEHMLGEDQGRGVDLRDGPRAVLARWAPDLLACYLGRTDTIEAAGRAMRSIMHGLQASWLVHEAATARGIDIAYRAAILAAQQTGVRLDADLVVLALADEGAAEQYAAFMTMPGGPVWPTDADSLLKAPGAPEFALYSKLLRPDKPPVELCGWLGLLRHSDLTEMPAGFAPVSELFSHESADVRAGAFRVAGLAPDKVLVNVLRDSNWTAEGTAGDEAVYGSLALCDAEVIDGEDRPRRIIPFLLGYLARAWPAEQGFAQAFAGEIKRRVDKELKPVGGSQGFGRAINDIDSYKRLVAEMPDEAARWLQPAADGSPISFGHAFFSADTATLGLSRALIGAGYSTGADVWRALMKSMRGSNLRSDTLVLMPFDARRNDVSEQLRRESLEAANLDSLLLGIVRRLQDAGETGWLIEMITGLLRGSALQHAKAMVLAGELDNDGRAEALWSDVILPLFLPAWLDEVRARAYERYRANAHAKIWLIRFCQAVDTLAAFAAFELFALAATQTCVRWAGDMIEASRTTMSLRAYDHWRMNVPQLNARLTNGNKDAKDQLAFLRVPKRDQAPWR